MADPIEVKVPDIGDFDDVEIVEVLIAQGDQVELETPLVTLESDKASMEVPSSAAGRVEEVLVKAGDRVSEGTALVRLTPGAAAEAPKDEPPKTEALKTPAPERATSAQDEAATATSEPDARAAPTTDGTEELPPSTTEAARQTHRPVSGAPVAAAPAARVDEAEFARAHASPAVRKFARELGADLGRIHGTGRKGRITRDDVVEYVKNIVRRPASQTGTSGTGIPPIPTIDFSEFGEIETVALSRIKKISGPVLHRAWVNVPHVTHHDEADITELDAFRKEVDTQAKAEGYRITLLSFLMKACAKVLREMPEFNASLSSDGQSLILKKYLNIGVAVDTPNGLVVPVVKGVDTLGIADLSKQLGALSKKARDGKLGPKDIQGGCFSISSLGGIGGTGFTPIVNAPEVAILGVTRSKTAPVWNGEAFLPRLMLPLSLSYDHRVVDGAAAARFTTRLVHLLSDARRMLL